MSLISTTPSASINIITMRSIRSILAFVFLAILSVSPSRGQDCTSAINRLQLEISDMKSYISLLIRQMLESAVNGRVKQTFKAVKAADETASCASTTPAAWLPLGEVDGIPDACSGQARCAFYCQNYDGCTSFNFFRKALADGTQCQLYTTAPAAFKSDANCQLYQVSSKKNRFFLKPEDILYGQDSIKGRFTDGRTLETTFRQLLYHEINITDLGRPIVVVRHKDRYRAVEGNRRLFIFKKLAELGFDFEIEVEDRTPTEFNFPGETIRVRGDDPNNTVDKKLDNIYKKWRQDQSDLSKVRNLKSLQQ